MILFCIIANLVKWWLKIKGISIYSFAILPTTTCHSNIGMLHKSYIFRLISYNDSFPIKLCNSKICAYFCQLFFIPVEWRKTCFTCALFHHSSKLCHILIFKINFCALFFSFHQGNVINFNNVFTCFMAMFYCIKISA